MSHPYLDNSNLRTAILRQRFLCGVLRNDRALRIAHSLRLQILSTNQKNICKIERSGPLERKELRGQVFLEARQFGNLFLAYSLQARPREIEVENSGSLSYTASRRFHL